MAMKCQYHNKGLYFLEISLNVDITVVF